MHRLTIYTISASLLLVLSALASGIVDANEPSGSVRDASSALAATGATPTYISELAPPVSRSPREAGLPSTGQAQDSAFPWVPAAGIALAVLGVLLTHAGLSTPRAGLRDERAAT